MLINGAKLSYKTTSIGSYTDMVGAKEFPDLGGDPIKVDNSAIDDEYNVLILPGYKFGPAIGSVQEENNMQPNAAQAITIFFIVLSVYFSVCKDTHFFRHVGKSSYFCSKN